MTSEAKRSGARANGAVLGLVVLLAGAASACTGVAHGDARPSALVVEQADPVRGLKARLETGLLRHVQVEAFDASGVRTTRIRLQDGTLLAECQRDLRTYKARGSLGGRPFAWPAARESQQTAAAWAEVAAGEPGRTLEILADEAQNLLRIPGRHEAVKPQLAELARFWGLLRTMGNLEN